MQSMKLFQQIYKFVIVGVINTAIDLAVLNLLILLTHQGKTGAYFTFYKGISFIAATINSYLLNKYWTFAGAQKNGISKEFAQFILISGVGFIINITVASLFVNLITPFAGLDKFWPSVAALCGTAVSLVFNFVGYRLIVFKHHKSDFFPPA